jgi:hypothetical protein
MQKTLIVVLTAGACIGLAATLAATYRPSGDQITGFAQSLADGVILIMAARFDARPARAPGHAVA